MPDSVADLAADLDRLRSGHGPDSTRWDLRRRLMAVDPQLRHQRNTERLRLAHLRYRLRTADTRHGHPGALQAAVDQCARRLAVLEQQVIAAIAEGEPERPIGGSCSPIARKDDPNPIAVRQARATLRAKLLVSSGQLAGLLPEPLVRQLQAAIKREIKRLSC